MVAHTGNVVDVVDVVVVDVVVEVVVVSIGNVVLVVVFVVVVVVDVVVVVTMGSVVVVLVVVVVQRSSSQIGGSLLQKSIYEMPRASGPEFPNGFIHESPLDVKRSGPALTVKTIGSPTTSSRKPTYSSSASSFGIQLETCTVECANESVTSVRPISSFGTLQRQWSSLAKAITLRVASTITSIPTNSFFMFG